MDSNENSEDNPIESSTQMEVSEPSKQNENEKQSDKISDNNSDEEKQAEEISKNVNGESESEKMDTTETQSVKPDELDSQKINTMEEEPKKVEDEENNELVKNSETIENHEKPEEEKLEEKKPEEKKLEEKKPEEKKPEEKKPEEKKPEEKKGEEKKIEEKKPEENKPEGKNSEEKKPAEVTTESASLPTPKETREGKRKRKSTSSTHENEPVVVLVTASEEQNGSPGKRKKLEETKSDRFCWRCHKESVEAQCSACPRSWHRRCMGGAPPLNANNWICGECAGILQAENAETRSLAMAGLTVDQLCMMLKHVVERMRDQHGSEPFWKAVDPAEVPNYLDYVIKPMDLSLLESNVRAKMYGSTDAFMADAKWIQHNCIVFNSFKSHLTNTAKQMLKIARQEVSEIEACPDCFSHGRNLPRPLPSWFIEPCRRPHPIVWAKLKGFPYWPAKALPRLNAQGLVDVRFFGEHDRAWVSPKDIYLYSQEPPALLPKKKKLEMEQCVKEVEDHATKLEKVFGEFRYAPSKVPYDPNDPEQMKILLPNYDPIENKLIDAVKPEEKPEAQPSANNKLTSPKAEKKSSPPIVVAASPKISAAPAPKTAVTPTPKTDVTPTLKTAVTPSPKKAVASTPKIAVVSTPKLVVTSTPKRAVVATPKAVIAVNTNGIAESPVPERRKLDRKRKISEPSQQPVKKAIVDVEPEVVITGNRRKSKSKSPPVEQAVSVSNNKTTIGEPVENNLTPEVTPLSEQEISNIIGPKKSSQTPVTKMKFTNVKKIKVVKSVEKEEAMRANATKIITPKTNVTKTNISAASTNEKPNNIVKPIPALNSLQNNMPEVIRVNPGQKPKTILQSNVKKTLQVTPMKVLTRIPAGENKLTPKMVNKVVNKDTPKLVIAKEMPISNKPMTAIPISTKKDHSKAMFMQMNSNASESARHFSEKDARLNPTVTAIKQEPRDDVQQQPKLTITRKASKARKSFPNKPTSFPRPVAPVTTTSHPISKTSSTASDAMVFIPPSQNDARPSSYELPPPEAGPATAQIHQNSKDLANKLAQLIADTIKSAAESNGAGIGNMVGHHETTIHYLKLRIERMKWEHQQEISELKHNNDLVVRELKNSMEVEKYRAVQDVKREAEIDKLRSIEETKRKQWCVVCGREAMFYCCWNTAYCDYPCQQKHWSSHINNCAQKTHQKTVASSPAAAPTQTTNTTSKGQQQNGNTHNESQPTRD